LCGGSQKQPSFFKQIIAERQYQKKLKTKPAKEIFENNLRCKQPIEECCSIDPT
jgi:hypothetical protein